MTEHKTQIAEKTTKELEELTQFEAEITQINSRIHIKPNFGLYEVQKLRERGFEVKYTVNENVVFGLEE